MKIGFVSLGCPKNLVDTEVMMGQLTAPGHELTPHPSDADVIVVNTCSFIDPAKQESVDTILEMAEYKKTGRAQKLIVAGCLVERYRGEIQKNMPEVDAVIGTNELEHITALCEGVEPPSAIPSNAYLYHDATPRVLSTPKHYAYIKIAEGCDHPCTFCVIPQYRGSVPQPPLRIRDLRGHPPVFARRARDQSDRPGHHLLRRGFRTEGRPGAAAGAAGADRNRPRKMGAVPLRYPNKVTQKLLDTIAEHDALVKYIDMPLQHASAAVLKRMKRGANGDIFLKLIERIRKTIPGVAIRTSMIVGFPGRNRSGFRRIVPVRRSRPVRPPGSLLLFRRRHQQEFRARRQSGRAHHLQPQAPADGLQRKISRAQNRTLVGREIARAGRRSHRPIPNWSGRRGFRRRRPISTASATSPTPARAPLRAGEFRTMRIIEAHDYDLTGELIDTNPSAVKRPRCANPDFRSYEVSDLPKRSRSLTIPKCPSAASAAA